MVMRRLIAVFLLAALPLLAQARPVRFAVIPEKTSVSFTIAALGFPTTHGEFRSFKGAVVIDLEKPERSSVTFTVATASVETRSKGLNDTIMEPSFLDARRFPTIAFTSTDVEKRDEQTVLVTGNLTLLGVTRPARFTVVVERRGTAPAFGFIARGAVRRSDFGMTGGFPFVADRVDIEVRTETARE